MKFKVGDVVKVINKHDSKYKEIGKIICIAENDIPYLVDIDGDLNWRSEEDIKLINSKKSEDTKNLGILNDDEIEYLGNVIKPKSIHDKVVLIKKICFSNGFAFIDIDLGDEDIPLPAFDIKSMYVGMKNNRKYSLGELGIDEYLKMKGGK